MGTVRSADGTAIGFDVVGEGPPVVLVSGAIQYRAIDQAFPAVAALLAPHFTVVDYDRRGRGESGDTLPYAVEREVEDIAALIEEVGGPASLIGVSSGAVLSLEAASRGLPIAKLALYEAPLIVDDTRTPVPADYAEHLGELGAAGRGDDAVEYFLTEAMQMPPEAVAGMRTQPFWPGLAAVGHTIAYDAAFMAGVMRGAGEPLRTWSSVSTPALVMVGGDSPPWMQNAARAIAEILPDSRLRTLEGQTHDVAPDVLAPVVEEFLASE